MSIKTVPAYTMRCDWSECDATADDGTDYAFWGEIEGAREIASETGRRGAGDTWFCDKHPTYWAWEEIDTGPLLTPLVLISEPDGLALYVDHLHSGEPCLHESTCPTRVARIEASHYDEVIQ